MFSIRNVKKYLVFWGILINLVIVYFIYNSPKKPVYDEVYFYNNFLILLKNGWSRDLILHQQNQAPGPLYQAFYYLLYKIGINVNIHLTRYCSLLFFNLGLWIFLKSFRKSLDAKFWIVYFSLFSVPFVYPILGMGLTETISMVFLSSALFFFNKFLEKGKYLFIILFALFYSIALVGRQNFLITFPCFVVIIFLENETITKKIISSIIACCSFLPLLYFISIWGGLVPPQQNMVAGGSIISISLDHGLLGLSYYGMLFFILNPNLFINRLSNKLIPASIIVSIGLEFFAKIQFLPFLSLLNKIPAIPPQISYVLPCFLISIGVYFVVVLVFSGFNSSDYKKNLSSILLNLAMAFSSFKVIHLFSSRYVAQASYLATGFSDEIDSRKISIIRLYILIIGSIAGLFSLYVYYGT